MMVVLREAKLGSAREGFAFTILSIWFHSSSASIRNQFTKILFAGL